MLEKIMELKDTAVFYDSAGNSRGSRNAGSTPYLQKSITENKSGEQSQGKMAESVENKR